MVEFCNWCPDPNRPDPARHPGGSAEHVPPQAVFLFVGGPLDGERRAVDRNPYGDLPLVQGATRSPQSGEWSLWNFACRPPKPHPRFHWYLLAEASGLDGGSPVYVGEDVKKQLALFKAGYKPEATGGK